MALALGISTLYALYFVPFFVYVRGSNSFCVPKVDLWLQDFKLFLKWENSATWP